MKIHARVGRAGIFETEELGSEHNKKSRKEGGIIKKIQQDWTQKN